MPPRQDCADLATKGFRVLDLTVYRVLSRPDRTGCLRRRRDGRLLHDIIDFELSKRSPSCCLALANGQSRNPSSRLD